MTRVVAAIMRSGGRILACRRRAEQSHGGKWEFPGGKLEEGETPAEALKRELAEELGIEAEVGDLVAEYEYAYPGRDPIQLSFFDIERWSGEPEFAQFQEARWVEPGKLSSLDFLAGDEKIVRALMDRARREPGARLD